MTSRRGWRRVFRLDVGRDHVERDVDEEIAFHLAMRAEKLRGLGADHETAAGQARLRFGDLPAIRDELMTIDHQTERAVKRGLTFEHLRRDFAYAIRALGHHAGFSAVVVLTLALGIGANTAIYSIVDALLLRPIPVEHPGQLVALGDVRRVNSWSSGSPRTDLYSYPLYQDLRDNNTVFSGLYGNSDAGELSVMRSTPGAATRPTPDRSAQGRFVTANYFSVLGIHAAHGRVFDPDADRVPGAAAEVVISDGYWARLFNRDPSIIGRTLTINAVPVTVIGVTPPSFTGDIVAQRTDLWVPVSMQPALQPTRKILDSRGESWLLLMGRLKPGVTLAEARSRLVPLIRRLVQQGETADPKAGNAGTSQVENIPIEAGARGFSYWRGTYADSLYTLAVAVALVLLIVCANVANLLLGRAASRTREVGVRLALGAGRARIVQQMMIESLTLSIAGAAVGLLFAWWLIGLLLRAAASGRTALPLDARLDGAVLLFTAVISVGAALLFGLVPSLRATRLNVAAVLRAQSRGITGAWHRFGAGRMLVMAQVALSLMMLVATGMVVRSLHSLETSDMGLDRSHLLVVTMSMAQLQRTPQALGVMRGQLAARLAALPGVAAVSYSVNGIFAGTESATTLTVPGFVARTESDSSVMYDMIGPGYFSAIGAPLVRGREFTQDEVNGPGHVAIVNRALAAKVFPNADPIGRTIILDSVPTTIVGVAADIHDHDLRATPPARLYVPFGVGAGPFLSFEVRTTGDPAALAEKAKATLLAAEPSLDIGRSSSLQALTENSIRQDVLMARFVSAFGILALLLAAMGLYGIMSYATARRTGEFGLRMALGASPADIVRMVLRDGLALIGLGILSGAPLIVVGNWLLRTQLFGVATFDVASIVFALVVLAGCALLAGLLPAARAARVGPLVALQSE